MSCNGGIPRTAIRCRPASARLHRNSTLPPRRRCRSRGCPTAMCTRRKSDFRGGFPVARAPALHRSWLAHCYGMVGVGRDLDVRSGSGAELYVVIGHAPRHLDRNVALVGRVVKGMELLSALPRGSAEMGFYAKTEAPLPIKSIRVAADVPAAERSNLEVIRTDSAAFAALDRIAPQPARGLFPGCGRTHRSLQCADRGARAPLIILRDARPPRCRFAGCWSRCALR